MKIIFNTVLKIMAIAPGLAALSLAILLTTPASTAHAIIAATLNLSANDLAHLARIEKYLNSITTMQSKFLQISSNGDFAQGNIILNRPRRMRLDYDPPSRYMIIADGTYIYYVDKEMEEATALPISFTPAEFILQENFNFAAEKLTVTGFGRAPGVLKVSLVQSDDPTEGKLTLIFSDKPLVLRKWSITDSEGIKTTVSLLGPRFGLPVDKELFIYRPKDIDRD